MTEMRKHARMTQRQVAGLFGVTASAVSEWERGNTTPEWHRLRRLDDAYGADGALLKMFGDDSEVTRYDALDERVRILEEWKTEIEALLGEAATLGRLRESQRARGGTTGPSDRTDTRP